MNDENVISIEKISAEFAQVYGEQIGKLVMDKINLEMAVGQLKARVVKLLDSNQALSNKIAALTQPSPEEAHVIVAVEE